jgi:hypothetical protein
VRPSPAQPSSAHAPLAPPAPHARTPWSLFPHFNSPAQQPLSLSLPSLSPCGALGFRDGDRRSWIPEVSSPPLPSPLSPTSSPSVPWARPLLLPYARPLQPLRPPARPLPPSVWRPGPHRGAAAPGPRARLPLLPRRPPGGAAPALPLCGLGPPPPRWPHPPPPRGTAPSPPPSGAAPGPLRTASQPLATRLPGPLARDPSAHCARPSQPRCVAPVFGSMDPDAARVASARPHAPPFTQRVPACVAPRAR